jgi:hypothetical protein
VPRDPLVRVGAMAVLVAGPVAAALAIPARRLDVRHAVAPIAIPGLAATIGGAILLVLVALGETAVAGRTGR